eukprot:6173652-Pleurochrysis_carterae.AAC.3
MLCSKSLKFRTFRLISIEIAAGGRAKAPATCTSRESHAQYLSTITCGCYMRMDYLPEQLPAFYKGSLKLLRPQSLQQKPSSALIRLSTIALPKKVLAGGNGVSSRTQILCRGGFGTFKVSLESVTCYHWNFYATLRIGRTLPSISQGHFRCLFRQSTTQLAVYEPVYFPRGPSLACNQSRSRYETANLL